MPAARCDQGTGVPVLPPRTGRRNLATALPLDAVTPDVARLRQRGGSGHSTQSCDGGPAGNDRAEGCVGLERGSAGGTLVPERARFLGEHDRNAVQHRVCQASAPAYQLAGRRVPLQRPFSDRADQDLEETRVKGTVRHRRQRLSSAPRRQRAAAARARPSAAARAGPPHGRRPVALLGALASRRGRTDTPSPAS